MGAHAQRLANSTRSRTLDESVRSFQSGARVWIRTSDLMRFTNFLWALENEYGRASLSRDFKIPHGISGSALRKAGNYIAQVSKQNLRRGMKSSNGVTGNLLSSYKVKVKKRSSGVLIGFNQKGHHAHLVDLGHEVVVGEKKIKTGKRTKPLMFHTDARQHLPQAGAIFVAEYERKLIEYAQWWDSQGYHKAAQSLRR